MEKELIRVVQRAQEGNEEAFQQLYEHYYKQAYGTAFKMCKNDADTKDVIQEAFFSIQKALPNLREPELFDFWMTRIIRTKCMKLFRKHRDVYMDDESLNAIPNKHESRKDFIPYEYTAEQEEKNLMHEFVERLSPKQKECIELFYFNQMSMEEVASCLGISVSTVKSRMFIGRKQMKQYIQHYEKQQGVRVHFRVDALLPITFFSFFQKGFLVKKLTSLKQKPSNHSLAMQTLSVVNVCASILMVGALGVGGAQLYQELGSPLSQFKAPPTMKETSTLPQHTNTSSSFPIIPFKGKEYANPKSMYYAILTWYQKSGTSTLEETSTIKQMYQAIKQNKGQYWDLLNQHDWIKQLEAL